MEMKGQTRLTVEGTSVLIICHITVAQWKNEVTKTEVMLELVGVGKDSLSTENDGKTVNGLRFVAVGSYT